jgi:pantoate--beta-alanine ligase
MDVFRVFYDFNALNDRITRDGTGISVGLIPTMGALHSGHLSLIEKALQENSIVVVTIFVNPKQFNNTLDLKTYPRTLDADLEILSVYTRLYVCIPDVKDVYPENDNYKETDLGVLDQVLEGKYRPRHFQGVAHVVHNLFSFIQPNKAYFGLKDFQQFAVIKQMVKNTGLHIELVGSPTIRNDEGLALSSRNKNLSAEQKNQALIIYKTLRFVLENKNTWSYSELKSNAIAYFNEGDLVLEYLDIVNAESFVPVIDGASEKAVCCISAYCENIRLIDNILL